MNKYFVWLMTCLLCVFSLASSADSTPMRKVVVDVKVAKNLLPADAELWTLYVYAAKPNTRLPLSNYKGKLSELPKTITLTESMYLLPHLTLKQAEEVVVIAKATKSKNPHEKSNKDLIAFSLPLSFDAGNEIKTSIEIVERDSLSKIKKAN